MTIGSPTPVANKSQWLANSTSSTDPMQPGQSDYHPAADPPSMSPPFTSSTDPVQPVRSDHPRPRTRRR
ncbi:hypothetical protein TIFTF001_012444 [Ficus carica]|uniref:Uncharacterized protein n=1 Tax=Ficus carica TaxID=3494 RepID=A0AA88DI28_FICCA|nr:hypothetical protein TIFTF001_012444 [Ficus carica]